MNSALKNYAAYVNNKIDVCEISLNQYISTDNILQNKQGIECAASLPIQGGKVTAFKKGDILLANIRPYLKKIWYAQFGGGCSTDVLAIRANAKIDSHFLFYALFRDDFFIHAMKGSKGTKMPRGDKTQIMEFKIPVFDPQTQQSIAAVLSALDKKIALNKQINTRLEEMAKNLYDYWFVQFDFPDADGKPYKSSGGEMVFDETLKREIPKGWEVKSLKDVLVNCSDNIKSEDLTSNMPYTPIDSLPMRKMTFSDFQKIENARTSLIRYSLNDILIGAMRVYFHRVCIAPFDGITRSTTIVLKPKKQNHLPFLYQLCNEEKTINFASKVSIGTQQPYVNWVNGLAEYKFAMPNLELIERYSIKIMPLIKSVITREKQNHQLIQLRDFLLPMLMNGQVSVAE